MKYLALLFLPVLGACSYTTYISGADEHGGTVNLVTGLSRDSAVEKAKAYCQNYHREARITATDLASNSMTFECDLPE